MYRDQTGMIIAFSGSREDSLNWTSHFVYLTDSKIDIQKHFKVDFGAYVRSKTKELGQNDFCSFYKNPWIGTISRDQLTGLIASLIKQKKYIELIQVILHHSLRLFLFSYNTIENGTDPVLKKYRKPDITLLNIWAMYLRGFGVLSWIFWPLLCFFDLQALIELIFVNKPHFNEDDNISYLIRLFVSREYVPTPVSWLTMKLLNYTNAVIILTIYWTTPHRNNAEMIKLYVSKLKILKHNPK